MTDYTNKTYWENMVKMSLSRYFVLYALTKNPKHGYDISKWIGELTEGCCCPTEGSLYPMLKEFEEGGYVTSEVMSVSGRERKVYTITEKGTSAFKEAMDVWSYSAKLVLDSIRQFNSTSVEDLL